MYNMNTVVSQGVLRSLTKGSAGWNLARLSLTSVRHGSFKVQDDKDFLEKVENSKEPVIVDFFAT